MQKYSNNIINQYGAPIHGASVKVLSIDGSLALIYSDNNSSPLTNPTTSDEYGQFSFYAKNGRYSITIDKQGVISQTISDILLEDMHDSSGNILVTTTALIGYGTGSGGEVIQPASDGFGGSGKSSMVTLNKPCGKITMHGSALASGAQIAFQLKNSLISPGDVIVPMINWTGTGYEVRALGTVPGSGWLCLKNTSAGSLSEAVVLNFVIIKGAVS